MELGAGEAQICRLCGQCESIYIDVFGEEGTKRFLGLKIHTKINILIKENDGLPQIVCMRCLGTLEFLCDFYESCHLTQKELMEASKNATEEKLQQDVDAESDKENAVPSPNDTKRKTKSLSPDCSLSTKSCLTVNTSLYYQTEHKDKNSNAHHIISNDYTNETQSTKQTNPQINSSLVSKKQSMKENVIIHERQLKNEQNNGNRLKCRKSLILEKINAPKRTINRNTRSGSTNCINSMQKRSINNGINSECSVQRKRGRKSKLEKMREAELSLSIKRKVQTNLNDDKIDNNQYKRHCLRTIYTNNKPNAVISSKPQIEQVEVDAKPNEFHDENVKNNITCNGDTILNDSKKAKANDKDYLKKKEDNSVKCKAISVIIKQEKVETESPQKIEKSNQLVWIPNEMLAQDQEGQNQKVQHGNPLLGEDMKKTISMMQHNITSIDHGSLKSNMFTEQNHTSVIKSSQTSEIIPKKIQEDSIDTRIDEMDDGTKDDLKYDVTELSLSRRFSQDSSSEGNKNKDKSFGRISELISDEQKQTIETYYTVNMSMVNSEEVQRNLTIVDKKNIRCNICGILYLRMDKCQVHIWGHLQMKPYQCKACDFATVTVSNVRCHIRKSHLKIKPFACHLCEKRYVTAALLEEHINTHTGARPFKCKLCDFASASRQMLSYHTSTHKPMKDVSCKICGKEFYSKGRLRAHMIIHNKDKVVMCKVCSAYLSNAEALETHHRNSHMQDYICNICGKRTKSKKALHNHQNVHAAAKYKCSLCPNVYKSSQILKEHLLKHEGIRKYKCTICEKSFGQQSHLAAHMAVHSEIRFHCPGCDKPFNRHDNMKIHTKRCKLFLANPDLKDFLNKKDKSISFNKITDLTEYLKNGDSSNSVPHVEDQNEKSSTKTIDDEEKSRMNFCKLGLNISCIKSTDQAWTHDDVYSETEEIAEINVIQITKVKEKLSSESENLTVLENVLGPESF